METNKIKQLKKDLKKQYRRLEDAKAKLHYATISDAEFRIRLLEAQIEEEKKYQPQPLSDILTKEQISSNKIVEKIIEMHLAADFLADSAMILRETLEKLGLDGCSLFPYIAEIKRNSEHFASFLCAYQSLSDFICEDDEYIEAAHKLTADYMNKTLKVEGTMTREEQIITACKEFLAAYPNIDQAGLSIGFLNGAVGADKNPVNVWHDVSEEPKINEDVVLYDCCGNFIAEFFDGSVTWRNIVLYHKATIWAYVKDLLPKGGTKRIERGKR